MIGCLAVIFSIDYMHGDPQIGRYYFLVLFFIGAMAGLVLTGSMLFLFIFWEITALCSYALISYYNDDPKAVAGGIKALIITQVGGVGLLVGALAVYAQTGSFQIHDFLAQAAQFPPALLGADRLRLSDCGSCQIGPGAVPHLAARCDGSPHADQRPDPCRDDGQRGRLPAGALLPGLRGRAVLAQLSVMAVGVLSALLAAADGAWWPTDLKRVLAYSTISQLGYMVYAIGAGGVFASQFHLLSHAVFKALLFLGAGAVIHAVGTRDMRQMGARTCEMPSCGRSSSSALWPWPVFRS